MDTLFAIRVALSELVVRHGQTNVHDEHINISNDTTKVRRMCSSNAYQYLAPGSSNTRGAPRFRSDCSLRHKLYPFRLTSV